MFPLTTEHCLGQQPWRVIPPPTTSLSRHSLCFLLSSSCVLTYRHRRPDRPSGQTDTQSRQCKDSTVLSLHSTSPSGPAFNRQSLALIRPTDICHQPATHAQFCSILRSRLVIWTILTISSPQAIRLNQQVDRLYHPPHRYQRHLCILRQHRLSNIRRQVIELALLEAEAG